MQSKSLSVDEVGAAVSILLGSPPASSLSTESSSKVCANVIRNIFSVDLSVSLKKIM